MDKQIPIYFDSIIVESSPVQDTIVNKGNMYHLKVRVFTKYANRNGSYITEEVAQQLIESATNGITPVIGFFDPETQTWASHTGPTLANAYGYVSDFLGWEPFADDDGITREYAVFSVNLFTEYFEEAKQIIGQNQSMELDPSSITGDWAEINNEFYYVYKTAKMLGFCVIGAHEPCFSSSAFFAKDENTRKELLEQFSSILFNLKQQFEELEKNKKGGEKPMDELNQELVVEEAPEVVETVVEEKTEEVTEFTKEEVTEETTTEELVQETIDKLSEFETLQNKFNELEEKYNELNSKYEEVEANAAALQQNFNQITDDNAKLREIENKYNELLAQEEANKKNSLIEKYEKIIDKEEIDHIRELVNDFSYDELESKLAISFANKQMAGSDDRKVPLPEPQESQFALLMKKYRKN